MGLFGSKGRTGGKYLDLLGFGPGGFPNQLAPTTNRKGRERCSVWVLVPAVVKARKAGSIANRCGYCLAVVRVLFPYPHRIGGRDIGLELLGGKVTGAEPRAACETQDHSSDPTGRSSGAQHFRLALRPRSASVCPSHLSCVRQAGALFSFTMRQVDKFKPRSTIIYRNRFNSCFSLSNASPAPLSPQVGPQADDAQEGPLIHE